MNERDFKGLILPIAFFLVGTIMIATGMGHPLPAAPPGCGVQKVERQTQIAYVLKPPPAPPPETIIVKESCPAPVAQKCESSQVSEKAAEEETAEPQRKRRKHRYRHWRRRRWTLM
jgi:hypothetical protein